MSSFKIVSVFLVFFFAGACNVFSQSGLTPNDSDKIKIGPEDLMGVTKGGRYFNFSDRNKVNIEITVLGLGAGKYLIPQGTTLFDFLIMVGGTDEHTVEDIKIVRFSTESPILKINEVKEYSYEDLYGDPEEMYIAQKNPALKPGDMLILPTPRDAQQSIFYYIRETIAFVGTLVSFYYLIDNLIYRTYYR